MSSDQSGSLARLRPEKLDDQMIQEQIALVDRSIDRHGLSLIFRFRSKKCVKMLILSPSH